MTSVVVSTTRKSYGPFSTARVQLSTTTTAQPYQWNTPRNNNTTPKILTNGITPTSYVTSTKAPPVYPTTPRVLPTGVAVSSTTHAIDGPIFNTLGLALVIAIPCLSVIAICCICAICCLKCSRLRQKTMDKWGWNRFGNRRDHLPSPHHIHHDIEHPFKTFAETNHYMDIATISAKKDDWEVDFDKLDIQDDCILGNGAFAFVYKGNLRGDIPLLKAERGISLLLEHQKSGKREVAIKRLPAHADHQNRLDFFHEIEFMKKLGYHTHVIAMLGCVSHPEDPMIVVEYCQKGDLLKLLRENRPEDIMNDKGKEKNPVQFRVKDLVSIAWQISDGMNYLDSKGFIHRDLAARNILITSNMVAKVSDFGLCRYVDSSLYVAKGGKLPIKWMALESLKFYEYSSKSDVWAYGVTLFEIFSFGDGPYPAIQPLEMIKYLEDGNRLPQPQMCPTEIYELMELCWAREKGKRPTFGEIKGKVAILLNLEDEHYGYLTVSNIDETVNPKVIEIEDTKTTTKSYS